jgi:hypothetical protein
MAKRHIHQPLTRLELVWHRTRGVLPRMFPLRRIDIVPPQQITHERPVALWNPSRQVA